MQKCVIRKLYCGNSKKVPADTADKKYSRIGTGYECLKKGFGLADWEHRKKGISRDSIQQIMYIGPTYEANFRKKKIYSIKSLISKLEPLDAKGKKDIIAAGCRRKGGSVDQKAFNSVVLFLHKHRMKQLPTCKIVKE